MARLSNHKSNSHHKLWEDKSCIKLRYKSTRLSISKLWPLVVMLCRWIRVLGYLNNSSNNCRLVKLSKWEPSDKQTNPTKGGILWIRTVMEIISHRIISSSSSSNSRCRISSLATLPCKWTITLFQFSSLSSRITCNQVILREQLRHVEGRQVPALTMMMCSLIPSHRTLPKITNTRATGLKLLKKWRTKVMVARIRMDHKQAAHIKYLRETFNKE